MKQLLMILLVLSVTELTTMNALGAKPFIYSIEEAAYDISIKKDRAEGKVLISGKIISGEPRAITLLGKEAVIAKVDQTKGGTLISDPKEVGKVIFLPDGKRNEFQIALSFLLLSQEDSKSQLVSFTIPPALRNSLRIVSSPEINLIEKPSITDANGVCHFSATKSMEIRFIDKKDVAKTSHIDVDSFSHIRLQAKRVVVSSVFVPVQSFPKTFTLQVQENAQYISSSLKTSWIRQKDGSSYEITIPSDEKHAFSIQFATAESDNPNSFTISLPKVQDNNGKEGYFVIDEPDDCQITLAGEDLISNIPITKLSKKLASSASRYQSYMRSPAALPVTLSVERFQSVSTPPIVLDEQYFFMSFEENGTLLSVIAMDIPAGTGPRLKLKIVPDTKIWSLTVNKNKRNVYTANDGTWVIPLEKGQKSQIQLSLIRKVEKLKLQGRLEVILPETGLPTKSIRVVIGLPKRVQLLSLEGPISPASGAFWKVPDEFMGKAHFFSRSFYKGQEMKLAVAYKEPVKKTNK